MFNVNRYSTFVSIKFIHPIFKIQFLSYKKILVLMLPMKLFFVYYGEIPAKVRTLFSEYKPVCLAFVKEQTVKDKK